MKISVDAPAKINIHLDILGKLNNGYHSLFMVMQAIGLYDTVIISDGEKGITLKCDVPGVPCDERNTAWKAAKSFFDALGKEPCVCIELIKRIPHEAGLAGGSADAAGVLTGLNEYFGSPFTQTELCRLGLKVGSDVPFCIAGGTCLSQNTGRVLSPLMPLKECFIVLAKPDRGVSTPKAYADADEAHLYHPDNMQMLDCCEKGDFEGICKYAGNVFEQVVEVPERVEIKRIMRENNASLTQMSGSGPTVFGIFENEEDALKSAEEIKKICNKVFVAPPVKCGPVVNKK